jgi:tetratricopeptide (TPR) repeat protein
MSLSSPVPTTDIPPPPDDNARRVGRPSGPTEKTPGPPEDVRVHDVSPIFEPGSRPCYAAPAVCGLLLLAVGLVFGQTVSYQFLNLDDDRCTYNNPHVTAGMTPAGIMWALASRQGGGGWMPLTWFSHMAVWEFFRSNAGGHHLVNVLLHGATAVLFFLVLRSMTGRLWPSALVAALFAIHPLRVESVAWVTGRKDILSGLFFMLTLAAYVNYVRRPFSLARYTLVTAFFILGIMSKPVLVTLPAVLLLLDYWPFGRFAGSSSRPAAFPDGNGTALQLRSCGHLVLEKLPLLVMVGVCSIQSLWTESEFETVTAEDHLPIAWRLGNGLVSYVAYIGKAVYPASLVPLYLHPGASLPVGRIVGAAVILSCISLGAIILWRRCPYLLVGWLWYLGMLVPVSGVVEFGRGVQAMADRFTYLPQIGLYLAFTWTVADVCRRWPWRRWVLGGTSALALAILIGCAWRQTSFWHDSETMWTHTLACLPRHTVAHKLLGMALSAQGRNEAAIQQFQKALEIEPRSNAANYNLGIALAQQGRLAEAMSYYRRSLELQPNSAAVHCALATVLAMQGRFDEALTHYRRSLQLDPHDALAHEGLAGVLMAQGRLDEAMAHCQRALAIQPNLAMAHNNLGNILARRGQVDEALTHYQRAFEIQPNLAAAHTNTGDVLAAKGQFREALGHYRKALQIQPNDPTVHRSLAWLRATCTDASLRNGAEAVELAQRANRLTGGKQPDMLDALAAAYAEAGWFPEALATARQALALAGQQKNHALVDALQDRIARYEAGKPYRQAPMAPQSTP